MVKIIIIIVGQLQVAQISYFVVINAWYDFDRTQQSIWSTNASYLANLSLT